MVLKTAKDDNAVPEYWNMVLEEQEDPRAALSTQAGSQ